MFEIFSLLGDGLLQSFEPLNLFMIFAGCLAGLFIGAMPGLGSVNGVAILVKPRYGTVFSVDTGALVQRHHRRKP